MDGKEENEGRSATYLSDEFKKRLKSKTVEYRLEIQLRELSAEDTNAVYNPSAFWTETRHPWHYLGTITLTTSLAGDINASTLFNVANSPQSTLAFPDATSVYDFNIVAALRKELSENYAVMRAAEQQTESPETDNKHPTEYLLHLVTGSHLEAGNTDPKCNIYVSIVGK